MVHGRTGTIGGRSAEQPTQSSTGKGRIVKEVGGQKISYDT